jgi:putative ABC transport system permease protein
MFQNLIKISLRLVQKNPFYFILNVFGLTLGISCCILISSYVMYELSFDKMHAKSGQIYRINYDVTMGGTQIVSPAVPVFVGPKIKSMFPEISEAVRFLPDYGERTIRHESHIFDETGFSWADSNFFKVFDFKVVQGNPNTALTKPGTLVITQSMAKKYFDSENPIGKLLNSNNNRDYEVVAVVEDIPSTSHFSFNFLTSIYSIKDLDESIQWNNPNYMTFLLLQPKADVPALEKKINDWVSPPAAQRNGESRLYIPLEPLMDVHFNNQVSNYGNIATADYTYLIVFSAIGFLILVIACVNYVNLATARASKRAKEVGLRKSVGASNAQLMIQFLTESFFMVMPSMILSIVLVNLLKPITAGIMGKPMPYPLLESNFLPYLLLACAVLAVAAGLYPAFILTRFKPSRVLKGNFDFSAAGNGLRHGLMVFQFIISTALIVGTCVVMNQVSYMRDKKLGIDREQVVLIKGNRDLAPRFQTFIESVRGTAGVEDAGAAWRSPFQTITGNGLALTDTPNENTEWVLVGGIAGDEHYIPTLGIQLKSGRNFDPSKASAKPMVNEFIVNEKFLEEFHLTVDEAIGKKVTLGLVSENGPGTIVGIVSDFHTGSFHQAIKPIVLFNDPSWTGSVLVRVDTRQISDVIQSLEKQWKEAVPMRPFNYTFLDSEYEALFRTEERISSIVLIFSMIAIGIACFGLLGLSSYTAVQRTKEIGIRKIMGATPTGIVMLLSKSYIRLLLIAFVVAIPMSYFFMVQWLESFAYKVDMSIWPFVLSVFGVLMITLMTLGYHSVRASMANPASTLKHE